MIYPKARRQHNISREEREPVRDPLAAVALSLELAPLADLAGSWEPLALKMYSLATALRPGSDGGTSTNEVNRLRRWADTWSSLNPLLQEFYIDALEELEADEDANEHEQRWIRQALHAALWCILDGYGDISSGPQYGRLKRMWIDYHGTEPHLQLVPPYRASSKP